MLSMMPGSAKTKGMFPESWLARLHDTKHFFPLKNVQIPSDVASSGNLQMHHRALPCLSSDISNFKTMLMKSMSARPSLQLSRTKHQPLRLMIAVGLVPLENSQQPHRMVWSVCRRPPVVCSKSTSLQPNMYASVAARRVSNSLLPPLCARRQ